jgi:hypothetical protein
MAIFFAAVIFTAAGIAGAAEDDADNPAVYEKLPVREVTIFKDGHAFVLHEGSLPVNDEGNVELDYLPRAVLGTFWAYGGAGAKLKGVRAARREVATTQPVTDLKSLLRANVGQRVRITDKEAIDAGPYEATLEGWISKGEAMPSASEIVLLRTGEGVKALPIDRVYTVTLLGDPETEVESTTTRNILTLMLENAPADGRAEVGMTYLQNGLRWIPNYRVELGENGTAKVSLQATLINDLADLEDVAAHLVIGVPTFQFEDQLDPIALQENLAQVVSAMNPQARFQNLSNNAYVSQVWAIDGGGGGFMPIAQADDDDNTARNEDLFLFTIDELTLKSGERMTVPVASFTIPYEDIYTVSIPFGVPAEMGNMINSEQQRQMAKLLAHPSAMHEARLVNTSAYPLTTAPALILKGGRLLAQSQMTYTPVGAEVDLPITTAVDVRIGKTEEETGRQLNVRVNGHDYTHVSMKGTLRMTNYRDKSTRLEIKRFLLGKIERVEDGGTILHGNVFDDQLMLDAIGSATWWTQFSWPWWWATVNGLGRAGWTVTLEPGQTVELDYAWSYFWL